MNEPLPGAVRVPVDDEMEEKPKAVGAAAPEPAARLRTEEEQDADFDEDRDDDDYDDERRDREAGVTKAAAEPPAPPIRFADVVSGQFDAEIESPEVASPKRVLSPQAETPKLHKVLAQAGLGSRREMEELIMEGRISVNGEPAHIGQRISFGDQIKVNGRPMRLRIAPPPARIIAYHKPVGEDRHPRRPAAPAYRVSQAAANCRRASGNRSDGSTSTPRACCCSPARASWPTRLMHPRFGLEREYAVRVLGALSKRRSSACWKASTEDGRAQFSRSRTAAARAPTPGIASPSPKAATARCAALRGVGLTVSRLIRIRYGAMCCRAASSAALDGAGRA